MHGATGFGKGGMCRMLRKPGGELGISPSDRDCAGSVIGENCCMSRPWISANLAISADGKISDSRQRPSGWTSKADHDRLISLRGNADALIVGRGTLEKDRMSLRSPGSAKPPLRCIVSRSGRISPEHPVFQTEGGAVHLLITGDVQSPDLPGVTIHRGTIDGFVRTLAESHGVSRLHCEGGGELIRSLAELDLLDELHLTLAGHTIFGGAESPTATGIPGDFLPASRAFTLHGFEPQPETGECFLTYRRKR